MWPDISVLWWHVSCQDTCSIMRPVCVCVCVSGVFSGADSSHLSEFLRAAALLREQFRFAHSTDVELGKKYGAKSEWVQSYTPDSIKKNTYFSSQTLECLVSVSNNFYGIKTKYLPVCVCVCVCMCQVCVAVQTSQTEQQIWGQRRHFHWLSDRWLPETLHQRSSVGFHLHFNTVWSQQHLVDLRGTTCFSHLSTGTACVLTWPWRTETAWESETCWRRTTTWITTTTPRVPTTGGTGKHAQVNLRTTTLFITFTVKPCPCVLLPGWWRWRPSTLGMALHFQWPIRRTSCLSWRTTLVWEHQMEGSCHSSPSGPNWATNTPWERSSRTYLS